MALNANTTMRCECSPNASELSVWSYIELLEAICPMVEHDDSGNIIEFLTLMSCGKITTHSMSCCLPCLLFKLRNYCFVDSSFNVLFAIFI